MSDSSCETVGRPARSGFWRWAVLIALAIVVGLGLLVARIANATSYLSDESTTCLNCHVMTNAYATWERGSHGRFTVCNDCHVPHDSTAAKLAFKAADGMKHSYVFTMRQEPQVLRLSEGAIRVVQNNCVRCHAHEEKRNNSPREPVLWNTLQHQWLDCEFLHWGDAND